MTVPPLLTEAVIGFRYWVPNGSVSFQEPIGLRAVTRNYKWQVGVNQARCISESECEKGGKPMDNNCRCGLYAYYDLTYSTYGVIAGAVLGWGQMDVYSAGFKSQYAKIIALTHNPDIAPDVMPRNMPSVRKGRKGRKGRVRPTIERIAKQFAELYEVPYMEPDRLRTYALEHGIVMPYEYRPFGECTACHTKSHEVKDRYIRPTVSRTLCPDCYEQQTKHEANAS